MKKIKILVLTIGAVIGLQGAYGQAELGIGLKGGLNFSSLSGSSSLSAAYASRTGYHFGAYFLIKLTKIGIQPEVLFSKQGSSFTLNSQNYSSNYDYISIPIMVKFYVAAGLNLQAGPQFSFLSSATGDVISSTGTVTTGQDLKNLVQSTDISAAVGLGWDLPFGLSISGRYNIGLSDINKLTGTASPSVVSAMGTNEAKSQVIQVAVGYRIFKLGK